ncbi:SDR family NAD(P)-dependent oxidoreductase [Candidatus Woesearchaeota archaeon]|nr:SDR family NAD(P)-dependent oxidoreductase [Candidatus Woesearchaeota archaeon]
MSKGRILITGGVGFIGTNVAEKFIQEGYRVIALDNLSRRGVHRNLEYLEKTYQDQFEFVWGDVRNPEDLAELSHEFVCVAHLGANPGIPRSLRNPDYDWRVNADGTNNVLEYVRHHGKPFILFASTNKVYSDKINELPLFQQEKTFVPVDSTYQGNPETFPLDGQGYSYSSSPYGSSKAAADRRTQEYAATYGIPSAIFRMSCIGGPHQLGVSEQGWISYFTHQFVKGHGQLTIYGTGHQVRDILDGRDTAEIYFRAFQRGAHPENVFNLGGGMENKASLLEVIDFLSEATHTTPCLSFDDWRVGDHRFYVSNATRVRQVFDWQPQYSWQQTVRDMIQEYGGTFRD